MQKFIDSLAVNPVGKVIWSAILFTSNYLFHDGKDLIPVFSLVALDGITGIMKACKRGELKSGRNAAGRILERIIIYLIFLAVGGIFDREFPGEYSTAAIKSFIMVNEAISIMENIHLLGYPVPVKFLRFLKVFSNEKQENSKK